MNWKHFLRVILTIGVIIFLLASGLFLRGCKSIAMFSGDVDEAWAVRADASRRLQNYHEFEDMYNLIKSSKATLVLRLENGEKFRDLAPEIMIINNDMIARYNSRSKQYDRNMWKSEHLPYQLDLISSIEDLRK